MSNLSVGQIIIDAQIWASRSKDLDALASALMVEAESNNRLVESLHQFQDDVDSLNRVTTNKSNADMINRIQQQNASSSEILKENRELKVCIEDYEKAMELIMQKYREHTNSKVLDSKLNFKEVYNEKLWMIIRDQRDKINEMAAVMQRAANADEEAHNGQLEVMARLRMENNTLRELLQISKQFGTFAKPIRLNEHLMEEKAVQTEPLDYADFSADELSLSGTSLENANNNSVIHVSMEANQSNSSINSSPSSTARAATAAPNDNAGQQTNDLGNAAASEMDNNNGPLLTTTDIITLVAPPQAQLAVVVDAGSSSPDSTSISSCSSTSSSTSSISSITTTASSVSPRMEAAPVAVAATTAT